MGVRDLGGELPCVAVELQVVHHLGKALGALLCLALP